MTTFHYAQRPAKFVERRMIAECCRRLSEIAPLKSYQYVGFGALEFVDFEIMHRELGIVHMVSIESNTDSAARYDFNKPYRTIDLKMGYAHDYIPNLDWSKLSIVWLDYECQLTEQCIRDVEMVGRLARPGSLVIVSVQAAAPKDERLAALQRNLNPSRIPLGLTEEALVGPWTFADVQRSILTPALAQVVKLRPEGMQAHQLLNFHYADDARMQTVGWILSSDEVAPSIAKCMFDDLAFVSRTDAKVLEVPVLTRRELAHLNSRLPLKPATKLKEKWLQESLLTQYASIYRYYPSYVAIA